MSSRRKAVIAYCLLDLDGVVLPLTTVDVEFENTPVDTSRLFPSFQRSVTS